MPYIVGEQWGPLVGAAKARLSQGWEQPRVVEWLRNHAEFGFVSRDNARLVVKQAAGEREALRRIAEGEDRGNIGNYFSQETGGEAIIGVYIQFFTEGTTQEGHPYRQRHGFAMNVPAGMTITEINSIASESAIELVAMGGSFGLAKGTVTEVLIDSVRVGGYEGPLHTLTGEQP